MITRNTPAGRYGRTASRIIVLLLCALIVGGWALTAFAQSPITAEVDRTTLSTDEDFSLKVTVSGGFINMPNPDLSGLADFAVISSGRSTQISIINGNMTSQGIFHYQLRPLKEGDLVIPPISVMIDGQTYQTGPINIEVTPGVSPNVPLSTPPPGSEAPATLAGQDLFVEAEVDNPTPYLGQQITYIFRFYKAADTPLHASGQSNYDPPPFTNFWGQAVLSQPYYSTTIDGRGYIITEIRTALFPANPGLLTIAPARLEIPDDLFTPGILLETKPIAIQVQSLPEGAPPDFSGAVGQFEIGANLSATESVVNEPLILFLDLEGAGNIEFITEPPLPDLPGWRIFDSQSTSKTEAQEDVVYGRRRFERLIVPGQPGDYVFPAISFSYYDPQAYEYRTIETEPIPVSIEPGAGDFPPAISLDPEKQPIQLASGDIRHIKPVPTVLESAGGSLLAQPLYWTFWILPAFIVGGIWAWQKRRQRFFMDSAYARSQRARRVAQKILAGAGQSGAGQSGADGYASVHRALLGYLADKLNRPTVGLTTNDLISLLDECEIEPALIKRVQATLTEIETSRFAPIEETAVQSLVSGTQKLINDLEKSFGGRR